ncbi:MAG: nitroreductase family protein, partial [Desulfovibrionales bacterium]|nr:nitroreductase family protein [Desulfovibrionales bacterium]
PGIFSCLKWAAYLTDWDGPKEGERPSAYIIMVNTAKEWDFAKYDQGIMAQTMMLGAVEKGFGGCIIASIERKKLVLELGLEDYEISLVLALGKPVEDVCIVDLPEDGAIKYYRDDKQVHYVPKRSVEELILQKRA